MWCPKASPQLPPSTHDHNWPAMLLLKYNNMRPSLSALARNPTVPRQTRWSGGVGRPRPTPAEEQVWVVFKKSRPSRRPQGQEIVPGITPLYNRAGGSREPPSRLSPVLGTVRRISSPAALNTKYNLSSCETFFMLDVLPSSLSAETGN